MFKNCFTIQHDSRRDDMLLRKLAAVPGATSAAVESVAAEATAESMSHHRAPRRPRQRPLPPLPSEPPVSLDSEAPSFAIESGGFRHTDASMGSSITWASVTVSAEGRRSTDASIDARAVARRRWRAGGEHNKSAMAYLLQRRDTQQDESHAFRVFDDELTMELPSVAGASWPTPEPTDAVGETVGCVSLGPGGVGRGGRTDPARRRRYRWGATRRNALRRTLARIRRRRAVDAETTVTGSTAETAPDVPKAAVASVAKEAAVSVSKRSTARTPAPQRYAPPPVAAKEKPTAPPRAGTPIPTQRRVSTEVGFARETKARISIFDDDYVRFAVGRPPAAGGAAGNRKLIRFAGRPSAHALA